MKARKVLKRVGLALLLLPVAVAALVALVFVSLRIPAVEREAIARTNPLLGDLFQGKIVLERVQDVTLSGARVDGRVLDAAGRTVIVVRGARATLAWPKLVWDAVRGANPLVVELEEVSVHDAVVRYVDAGDGSPTLAAAFAPKKPTKPEPEPPGPPTETKVFLRNARIDHAWVYGGIGTDLALDADLSAFSGSFQLDGRGWAVNVEQLKLATRNLLNGLDPAGSFQGGIAGAMEGDAPPDAKAKFQGTLARTPFELTASLEKGRLDARVDAPDVAPEVITRLVPALTPLDRSRLSVTAEGTLPAITVAAEVGSGAATVRVDGKYDAKKSEAGRTESRVTAKVVASAVDVSRLLKDSVQTELDGTVEVDAKLDGDGGLDGKYTAKFHGAKVDGQLVPNLDTEGHATIDAPVWKVKGAADIDEPGAPTHVLYQVSGELSGNQSSTEVVVDVDARLDKPQRLVKLAGVTTSGRLHATARLWPEKEQLTAKLDGKLGPTAMSGVSLGDVTLNATAAGSLKNPLLDVQAAVSSLKLPGRSFERATFRANGKPDRIRAEAELTGKTAEIRLYATVAGTPALTIEKPAVTLTDEEGVVRLATSRVAVRGKRIEVEGLTLDGAGHAEASVIYDGDLRRLQFESTDLDIARLLRIAEVDGPKVRGKLSLVASYAEGKGSATALVRGKARNIDYDEIHDGSVELDLTLADRTLSGKVLAVLGKGARAGVNLEDVTFDGKLTNPDLKTVRGLVGVEVDLDLDKLQPLLAASASPVDHAGGKVTARVVVQRERADQFPDVTLDVKTTSLELVGKRPELEKIETSHEALEATAWALRGVDLEAHADLGGDTHELRVQARAADEQELATLAATVQMPPGRLDVEQLPALLDRATGSAVLRMPPRRLRQLPEIVKPRALTGTLGFELKADGSVNDPHVNLAAELSRFGAAGQRTVDEESTRIDATVGADYRKSGGHAEVLARYRGKTAVKAEAKWRGDAVMLGPAVAQSGPSPIVGDVDVVLDAFPLDAIAQAKNRQIGGSFSGKLAVKGLGENARAEGRIEAAPLELGQTALERAGVSVEMEGTRLLTRAWAKGNGGSLEARLESKFVWKDALLPVIDPNLASHVSAKRFRLGVLSPFLAGVVSEVDGRLDAELDAKLTNGVPALEGHAEFDSGSVSLPVVGQQMTDIRGKLVLNPRQAKLTDFHAKGETGALSATATVDFADRFQIASARAEVKVAEDEKLPVTLEGVTFGEVWGKVEATIKKDTASSESRIAISVPDLHVDIPETGQANVQALDPDSHVRIGAVRKDGVFTVVATQPLESKPEESGKREVTVIDVKLGKIAIRRGEQVKIGLTGELKVRLAEEMKLTGQIRTTGGKLDVAGKLFELERGAITFDGANPPNPTILVTARWDSPVGYRVYAEYSGTAVKAKLTLRSEPALSSDQVLNLLMFGTPDQATQEGSKAAALSVAGGVATKGINRALSDISDLDVEARVDSTGGRSSGPYADTRVRPELAFQVSQKISARVTRVIGEPLAGTTPDKTFLTFDYRLNARWLVSTMVGDRGATALDLLWRFRY